MDTAPYDAFYDIYLSTAQSLSGSPLSVEQRAELGLCLFALFTGKSADFAERLRAVADYLDKARLGPNT